MKKLALFLGFLLLISTVACNSNLKTINSGKAVIQSVNGNTIRCQKDISTRIDALTDKDYTIFFLSRHAEKIKKVPDPDLLPEGHQRAQRLASILQEVPIDMICSSPTKRTNATAQPTAAVLNMEITKYNPKPQQQKAFFNDILLNDKGARILVVGHSNTIPDLLNFFAQESVYTNIDEGDYDNFYIVAAKDGKPANIWSFKY